MKKSEPVIMYMRNYCNSACSKKVLLDGERKEVEGIAMPICAEFWLKDIRKWFPHLKLRKDVIKKVKVTIEEAK